MILVANKVDLAGGSSSSASVAEEEVRGRCMAAVSTSAASGAGLEALSEAIIAAAGLDAVQPGKALCRKLTRLTCHVTVSLQPNKLQAWQKKTHWRSLSVFVIDG